MDKYQETFDTWNKVASQYQDKFMDLDLYNETYDFICNSLKKNNSKILEVGCGPANITKYLLSQRPDFDIFGIDIAPNMIELAKKNNPTASFSIMDSRNINELNTKFDGIICGFCLPYLSHSDSKKFIRDSRPRWFLTNVKTTQQPLQLLCYKVFGYPYINKNQVFIC